jgi:hypothetical protein
METLAGKVGSSIGVVVGSVLLRRFLLRSFGLALLCLVATEVVAFAIILQFTGLLSLRLSDLSFNVGWLYSLTWNVVFAFLLGVGIGHIWGQRWGQSRRIIDFEFGRGRCCVKACAIDAGS